MGFFDYFLKYYYHLQFGATYVITELVCCLVLSVAFNVIRVKDYKSWIRLVIDWAITFASYLLIACLFYYIYEITGNDNSSGNMRFFVWAILAFLHVFYPKDIGRIPMRLTCASACSLFIVLAINSSGSLGTAFTDANGRPSAMWNDFTLYLVLVLLVGVVILFKTLSPFQFKYVKHLPIVLVILSFMISYFLSVISSFLLDSQNSFIWILNLSLLVLDMLAYTIFYINVKNYNEILDFQARVLKAESEKYQMEISKAQFEELHRIRHDLKNQMAALESLLKNHKYEEMAAYFSDLDEKVHVTIDYVDSSNTIVDAILNAELAKSKAHGIPLHYRLSVPEELSIRSDDLNSIISNLIDNALEYEVDSKLNDPIEFSMMFHEDNLLITCKNVLLPNVNETELLKLRSKKKNRLSHGYGTKIIKSICEKYHGVYKFKVEDKKMVFEGMLNLEEEAK